ncbi:hypothetical protein JCM14124_21400 [Humidesulfovibrio idahonensis]
MAPQSGEEQTHSRRPGLVHGADQHAVGTWWNGKGKAMAAGPGKQQPLRPGLGPEAKREATP